MPARRTPLASRAAAAGALLVALAGGCTGTVAAPPHSEGAALCEAGHLDACEKRIAAALGNAEPAARDLVASYAAARAARDASDPWAKLYGDLDAGDRGPRPKAVLIAEGTAAPETKAVRAIAVSTLPAPGAIQADDLLLAMTGAAGYEHVVRVRAGEAWQLYPNDPLAPVMAGIRPALRDDTALAHLEADLAMEEALRAAFEGAANFRYLEAVRAGEKLSALTEKRDTTEPLLRAQRALTALGTVGLVLDAEENEAAKDAPPPPPAPPVPPPDAKETAYASYLRVLSAKDWKKEWAVRGPRVVAGMAEDRREDMIALYAVTQSCDARRAPPMERPADLIFASRLSGSLARDASLPPGPGQLSLRDWMARYETMLGLAERTRLVWFYLPTLLQQRGDAPGLSQSATPVYRRVTDLGLAHLTAIKAVEEAYPVRYRSFTQIGLAVMPGLIFDDKLRQALVKLAEASVQDKIAAAKDPSSLLLALAAGVGTGLSYPPAFQEAHFLALAGATSARLKGDFLQKTGWGVAALYAIEAVYRLAASQGPNLGYSSGQIARALAAPDVKYPALAALATATSRYAALAAQNKLDPSISKLEQLPSERRAARDGLRAALAGLGAPGEAPANVLDDITDLTDGLVATLTTAITDSLVRKAAPKPGTCETKKGPVPLDPTTRRALARLGDVRQRILAHPRYKQGDGLWVRRVRLLVTLLSDAMDIALGSDARKNPVFKVDSATAQKVVEDAMREIDQKAITELVAGGYGLVRGIVVADDAEVFIKKSSKDLRRVASGLLDLFRGDALGGKGPQMGVALLDALASMRFEAPSGDDVVSTLVAYAGGFYEKNQPEQGDLCLLATLVLSGVTKSKPSPEVLAMAEKHQSRIAWALRFSEEVHKSRPDPSVYAEGMRKATDDSCQVPDAETTIAVMQAVHDFGNGKRKEARMALDRVLARADEKGLNIPRMSYRYDERTPTKIFTITVDLSYGSGILAAGNTFQLGLGFRSAGEPDGSLTVQLAPPESQKGNEDTARYYVYTAALATMFHFIEGDHERAMATAQRVVAALAGGIKLGTRTLRSDRPLDWGSDARELLIVDAQLAADAAMPFLAGDLWTMARQGLSKELDDKAIASLLDRVPFAGTVKEVSTAVEHAKRSLKVLAEPLPCTDAKVEVGGFEEPACDTYPVALSLRIADVLKKMPRLRRGDAGGHCGPLRSLDAFLGGAEKGRYDPDAFSRAVEELKADGKLYDAATLMARQKHPNHCSSALVSTARALGRSPVLGSWMRADLLGAALNCTAAGGGADVEADLLAMDEETRKLPDPSRNLKLVLSIAELATRTDQWGMLGKLVDRPDFLSRWMGIHPNAAAAALLLDHAVTAIGGQAVALDRTKGAYELLCTTLPASDRTELCGMITALRAPLQGPMAERQRVAKESVKKLLASVAGPPQQQQGAGRRP